MKVLIAILVLITLAAQGQVSAQTPEVDERGCLTNEITFAEGEGCWTYYDDGALASSPVRMWYYMPESWNGRVLYGMHGSSRQGWAVRDNHISYAYEYGYLVIAPEFGDGYGAANRYNTGYVHNTYNRWLRDESDWTFTTIEEVHEIVKTYLPEADEGFYMQGHSAGGQFIHRFALMKPRSALIAACAANAAWYQMEFDPDTGYGYGCYFGLSDNDKQLSYVKRLIVAVGENDNDPNSSGLYNGTCAPLQGAHRYERGLFFFGNSALEASTIGMPFRWEFLSVPGVGHSSTGMLGPCIEALFE